ncbi:hypothetical protein AAC387_Pa03g4222 [Persea americana]
MWNPSWAYAIWRVAFLGRGDGRFVPLDEFAGHVYLLNESGLKITKSCRIPLRKKIKVTFHIHIPKNRGG